ncbi:MAG: DNA-binding response regulator [Candidatus Dadabacteria bacterium]|nr:MAG: DNA-binding response regulator [Candidatus Dadabacteria bacterium]
MYRILIIEDDVDLSELLEINLADCGYEIKCLDNGRAGLKHALKGGYDLVILDVQLPELSGTDICRELRLAGDTTPILMISRKSADVDKVLGLELGADDYLVKPFSVLELTTRVRALIRRASLYSGGITGTNSGKLIAGKLVIIPSKREVLLAGTPIDLTVTEYNLLDFLAHHPGRAFTREELLQHVWGYESCAYEHTVSSHINRLRSKIEDNPANPVYIKTVWGHGYRFATDAELQSIDQAA